MAEEIIGLVRQWQNQGQWRATFENFADWQRQLKNVNRDHGLEEFYRQKENAEILHRAFLAADRELLAIKDYLRENAPLLLERIPIVDWSEHPADYRPLISSMARLEGELLAAAKAGAPKDNGKPPADGKPSPRVIEITKNELAVVLDIGETTLRKRINDTREIRLHGEHGKNAKLIKLDVNQFAEPQRKAILAKLGLDT